MAFSTARTISALLGAACLAAVAAPASAGTLSVAPLKDISASAPVTDVAYRRVHVRSARHVHVRRHYIGGRRYVGHRHYYYRRHSAFPAAALGLIAGAIGASTYDDCGYGYGYGYGGCGYYPSYSYGYDYPYTYSYGYGRRVYRGGYAGHNFYRGGYGGQHFGGARVAGFRGGMGGGGMRMGGGGMRMGGGAGGMRGGGGGGHHR